MLAKALHTLYAIPGTLYPIRLFARQKLKAGDLGIPGTDASATSLNNLLGIFFFFAGALSVIFIIVGGFRYAISQGNPEATQQAKNTILYAVVGLVVSVLAGTIVGFVTSQF